MAQTERASGTYRAPALYLIVSEDATAGRPLLSVVERVLLAAQPFRHNDGQLPLAICLREKYMLGGQLFSLASNLLAMTKAAGATLFINGRLDVAVALGVTGLHLPEHGIPVSEVRAAMPHLRVGRSTHAVDEVIAARAAGADFVVFGPVHETPSKTGILAPRGLEGLTRAAASCELPVLALGGVDVSNAAACKAAGAAGVACIRAVLAAEDPAATTVSLLKCFVAG